MPKISVEHFQNYKLAVKMHILPICPAVPALAGVELHLHERGQEGSSPPKSRVDESSILNPTH